MLQQSSSVTAASDSEAAAIVHEIVHERFIGQQHPKKPVPVYMTQRSIPDEFAIVNENELPDLAPVVDDYFEKQPPQFCSDAKAAVVKAKKDASSFLQTTSKKLREKSKAFYGSKS